MPPNHIKSIVFCKFPLGPLGGVPLGGVPLGVGLIFWVPLGPLGPHIKKGGSGGCGAPPGKVKGIKLGMRHIGLY